VKTLLDTCFVSELNRRSCDSGVRKAYEDLRDEEIFLSVITAGEIIKGIRRLPESRKRDDLSAWLRGLDRRYERRILPVDRDTVEVWGDISAAAERGGSILPPADGLIAATAIQHGLRIYTRNVADFSVTGARVTNPWGG
jgi:predicted nucleic acid-binding protein